MDPVGSFSGVTSGIQFRDLVDAIIAAERRPVERAQTQVTAANSRKTALSAYRGVLATLRTAVTGLRDGTAFDARSATVVGTASGGRPVLRANGSAAAVPGRYNIEVLTLAAAEKRGSLGQADSTTALGQTGEFTVNGQTVTVDAADSLGAIRDKINAINTGPSASKVTATVLTVSPTDHRLILTSDSAGAAGISLADTTGTLLNDLGLLGPGGVLVAGADASLRIDGVPLTRTANVIADAIEGITLTLETAEPGTIVALDVARYTDETIGAVKSFVSAYNAVVDFFKKEANGGTLRGDATLRTNRTAFSQSLLTLLGGEAGLETTGSAVGLSLDRNGRLSLDDSVLTKALQENHASVQALFGGSAGLAGFESTLEDLLTTASGVLDSRTSLLTDRVSGLELRIARMEGRLAQRRTLLIRQFTRMESAIGTLQQQGSFLGSQLAALTAGGQQR